MRANAKNPLRKLITVSVVINPDTGPEIAIFLRNTNNINDYLIPNIIYNNLDIQLPTNFPSKPVLTKTLVILASSFKVNA